ncbi:hypothetical protein D3C72_1889970 [compost metagenome]
MQPDTSGSSTPQVRPKEWNSGSAIMNLSSGVKSATARTWATLDSSELCECTTPLGLPSEPEVNSTSAASSGCWGIAARRGTIRWASSHRRSAIVSSLLRSSRYSTRTPSSHSSRGPRRALSMKVREATRVWMLAAVQAARRPSLPAV